MLYLNQRKYPDMPYQHNLKNGGAPPDKTNISAAGCGLCCLCMIVENMTMHHLSLEDCRQMAYDLKANQSAGTNLTILGPAVAQKFGLTYAQTDNIKEMIAHVRNGGMAVANSGGDREGYEGVFTHGGHYILVIGADETEACILDPALEPGKFDSEGRKGKVQVKEPFAYCNFQVLQKDCENRSPAYYLFARER